MDVGVERSNRFAKWEMLNEQKSSIERKLKQAEMNAVMKKKNPEEDDKVKKYAFHLKEVNKALQRF